MSFSIVMLAPRFYPSVGGVEHVVRQISKGLVAQGIKVSVLTLRDGLAREYRDSIDGVDIYRFDQPSTDDYKNFFVLGVQRLQSLSRYWKIIWQADAIHCHDWSMFIYWYLPFRFLFFFKPVYITFHGNEGIYPIPKRVLYFRKIAQWLTKDHICVGDYLKKWYKTPCDKVVYGGLELIRDLPSPLSKDSAVFAGRLEPDTGIVTYLSAIKMLKYQYDIELHFNIFGEGSLREEIQVFIDKWGLNNVVMHGYFVASNNSAVFAWGNYAFVSQNLAMLEAMASHKLVFAVYDNPLKKDYIYSYPNAEKILVASRSAEDLVEKFIYYQQHPLEAEQIRTIAYSYASSMTWDKAVATHLKMYGLT
jgi:glycosyltransferase involved in cell wall biosynthesis